MKITKRDLPYAQVMTLPKQKHKKPCRPFVPLHALIRVLSIPELLATRFRVNKIGMDKLGKKEPCLILMNHSCFLDLKIASACLFPRPFHIVCTSDGFVGKNLLMRLIGCIPTMKFVTDLTLVRDMLHVTRNLGGAILMYPEASYSFDGTATALPRKFGVLLKKFDVPVIMIETRELFLRNPLYNELQQRKGANARARAYLLYSKEDVRTKSVKELSDGIDEAFTFDHFQWQKDHGLEIHDDFRADGLHRILYKCTECGCEEKMEGRGKVLTCHNCGKQHELTPLGELKALEGETKISHIPDYYRWEREQVRQEILDGTYEVDTDVTIAMQVDYKAIYMVGEGHLTHDRNGFRLTGCDGKLNYTQKPQACYSLYADYYWYEIADCVCIGDNEVHYFLFPKEKGVSVAKMRLAVEEMYKLYKARKLQPQTKDTI